MLFLAIVGMPGAGKTSVAEYLKSKSFPVVRLGGVVTSEVLRRGLPLTPENEQIVRENLRAQHGMDVMARMSLPQITEFSQVSPIVVIDGLYSFAEYKTFNHVFGEAIILISVAASRTTRYQRLERRPERPLTAEQAKTRDFREIEVLEKGGPIAIADYTLVNDGAPTELYTKVDQILKRLEVFDEENICAKIEGIRKKTL